MYITWIRFLLIMIFLLLNGCIFNDKIESIVEAKEYLGRELWTATNLHIIKKEYIHAKNYLAEEIFPLGTAIRLKAVSADVAIFIDNYNENYTLYWNKKNENLQFKDVFHKYFRVTSPDKMLEDVSVSILESISLGEVKRGMRKEYVLLALGYPINKNPKKENLWIYWETKLKKRAIYFEDNNVTEIIYDVSVQ